MGSLFGGGSTTTTQTSNPTVDAAVKQLMGYGQKLMGGQPPIYTPQMAQQYSGYTPGLVAPMSPDQYQAFQSIRGLQGSTQPYYGAAAQLAALSSQPLQMQQFSPQAVNQYMSPYLNNVVNSAVANINQTNAQQQQQVLGNAIQRGAFGGDRGAIAQAELARQQNLANNATIANLLNTGYGQALGEFNQQQQAQLAQGLQSGQLGLTGAQTLANLGTTGQQAALAQAQAQYAAGAQQQAQQQAGLSTAYQQYLNQFQYPYNQVSWLGGLLSGAAPMLGGTTTATAPQPSLMSTLLGIGGLSTSSLGGSLLSGLFSSDERSKENIEPIGKTYDGQNIYRYNYKGDPRTNIGLIAQEVEQDHPQAVGRMDGGLLGVNYKKATDSAAHRGHFDMGGDVGSWRDRQDYLGRTSDITNGQSDKWFRYGHHDEHNANANANANTNANANASTNTSPTTPPPPSPVNLTSAYTNYLNVANSPTASFADMQAAYNQYLGATNPIPGAGLPLATPGALASSANANASSNASASGQRGYTGGDRTSANANTTANWGTMPQIISAVPGTGPLVNAQSPSSFVPAVAGPTPAPTGLADIGQSLFDYYSGLINSGGLRGAMDGGRINKAGGGEINMNYGLLTKDDLQRLAEEQAQSGVYEPSASTQALSSQSLFNFAQGGLVSDRHGYATDGTVVDPAQQPPQPDYQAMAEEAAKNAGIDPDQYKKLIGGESGWKVGKESVGDQGSSGGLLQMHVAGASQKYPNSGLGDVYLQEKNPELHKSASAEDKIAYLSDPNNQKDIMDWSANYIKQHGADDWTVARNQGLFGSKAAQQAAATQPKDQTLIQKIFPNLNDPQQLANFKFWATLAGTPGSFGVGLASAANAYADQMMASQRLGAEVGLKGAQTEEQKALAGKTKAEETEKRTKVNPLTGELYTIAGEPTKPEMVVTPGPGQAPAAAAPSGTVPGAPTPAPAQPKGAEKEGGAGGAPTPEAQKIVVDPAADEEGQRKTVLDDYAKNLARGTGYTATLPETQTSMRKAYTEAEDDAHTGAKAAQSSMGDLRTMAHALAQTQRPGVFTSGEGANFRLAVLKYGNTFSRGLGGEGIAYKEGADPASAAQELDKISQFTANQLAGKAQSGHAAARTIDAIRSSLPNADIQPEAANKVFASLARQNVMSRDYNRTVNYYGTKTGRMGSNVVEAYGAAYPSNQYDLEQSVIEKLMSPQSTKTMQNGERMNLVTALMENKISPERFNQEVYNLTGGKVRNLSRWFVER